MQPTKLTPTHLEAFMRQQGITGEILYLSSPTLTVETAAQAVGAPPDQIIKSILFLIDDHPILAINCGTAYIERRAIAAHYGVGRKRVKLAAPEEVLTIAGFEVGSMPPFGHLLPLETLLDLRVLDQTVIYGGGGAENALVRLTPQEILRVTHAQVLDLLAPPDTPA